MLFLPAKCKTEEILLRNITSILHIANFCLISRKVCDEHCTVTFYLLEAWQEITLGGVGIRYGTGTLTNFTAGSAELA
jgi:hypothetical protein